ncbi:hypothetical protein Nhal_2232 [Nitrosococcus halophilus Nc 4]|uniref:Uncharacterized protein n=1 Tax=Nitrosococcus halophilus (strain Nc4) TaxID=472759 RepID=D5C5A0_NITHN|nr:hypothetical protein Nhal_2232 [Nitrosococcus halophilus Nc 4]
MELMGFAQESVKVLLIFMRWDMQAVHCYLLE